LPGECCLGTIGTVAVLAGALLGGAGEYSGVCELFVVLGP